MAWHKNNTIVQQNKSQSLLGVWVELKVKQVGVR